MMVSCCSFKSLTLIFLFLSLYQLKLALSSQHLYYYKLKNENGLLSNCSEYFYSQPLDHYKWKLSATPNNISSLMQRYFICGGSKWKQNEPIFFYFGNEANVELYINNTGLMWENQNAFNAIMVFAEHRFYGNSIPFTQQQLNNDPTLYRFVIYDQALADYASLIYYLKTKQLNSWKSNIIGFGGSYGAMLCAWFSIKYPQWIDGCISGSGPILDFEGIKPSVTPTFFAQGMTFDASSQGGGNDLCKNNIHKSWKKLFNLTKTIQGRQQLTSIFKICTILSNETISNAIAYWAVDAITYLAMGSYPYPNSYMTSGNGILPAYPLRYACNKYMIANFSDVYDNNDILYALSNFIGVYYNASKNRKCYSINEDLSPFIPGYVSPNDIWGWRSCMDAFQRGTFHDLYNSDGINDMFWNYPYNIQYLSDSCYKSLGIRPRINFTAINFGGNLLQYDGVKNIVFSNGLLDPWSNIGVNFNNSKNGVYSIITGMVGHHMDLMFSSTLDPESVIHARNFELQQINNWINK